MLLRDEGSEEVVEAGNISLSVLFTDYSETDDLKWTNEIAGVASAVEAAGLDRNM